MSDVTVITYEIVGSDLPFAVAHQEAIEAHKAKCWELVDKIGGCGFRPCSHTSIRSFFFDGPDAPTGLRKFASHDGKIECRTNRATKAGKEIEKEIVAIGRPPSGNDLAAKFGWDTSSFVMSGTRLYFPTFMALSFPTDRYFLRLPRQLNDRWECPPGLVELRESELMAAVEEHNAEARRQKGGAA